MTINDMTDAQLGAIVRKEAERFPLEDQAGVAYAHSAALMLIMVADGLNSKTTTIREEGCMIKGVSVGDWEVIVRKIEPPVSCHADRDGDCYWSFCPQRTMWQPHCPLDRAAADAIEG